MARPEIPEEELLSRSVAFRVTQRDFVAYKKKFEAAGVSQSQFFRNYVLANKTQVIAKAPSPATAERAVFLLSKASNNLNQLAHRAHVAHLTGVLTSEAVDAIAGQLQSLNSFMLEQTKEADK